MYRNISREQWFSVFLVLALAGHFTVYRWKAGAAPLPEWPLLFDLFITFPLLYFLLCRPGWKQFLQKWGRVLARAVERYLGTGTMARLALLEARIQYYALLMRKTPQFEGEQHFHTAKAGGNASNRLAWLVLIAFDIPIAHLVLHYVWSPMAAWVSTVATLLGLMYLLADYRATLVRPISLGADALLLRCGAMAADAVIPYAMIESVQRVPHPARRLKDKRYYRHQGENVEITLRDGSVLPTLLGAGKPATHAVIGVDDPAKFVEALRARLT